MSIATSEQEGEGLDIALHDERDTIGASGTPGLPL